MIASFLLTFALGLGLLLQVFATFFGATAISLLGLGVIVIASAVHLGRKIDAN